MPNTFDANTSCSAGYCSAGCLAVDFGKEEEPLNLREWIERTADEISRARSSRARHLSGQLAGYRVNTKRLARSLMAASCRF